MTTKTNVKLKETILQLAFHWLLLPFCFGVSAGSPKFRVEETAELLKSEDAQFNTLEKLFQFWQLCRWLHLKYFCLIIRHFKLVGEVLRFGSLTLYFIDTHFNSPPTELLKPLWEKEKLLVTSNFSFSHNVFNSIR